MKATRYAHGDGDESTVTVAHSKLKGIELPLCRGWRRYKGGMEILLDIDHAWSG